VAVNADVIGLVGGKSEKLLRIGTMLVMAGDTGQLALLAVYHDCLLAFKRMPGFFESYNRMGRLSNAWMAFKAEIIDLCLEKSRFIRCMRLMAFHAETRGDDRMNHLFAELRIVMAVKAKGRQFVTKQPFIVGLMRLMAGHAHGCLDRRVYNLLPQNLVLAMAAKADIRNLFQKELLRPGSVRRMAPDALAVVDRAMNPVFAGNHRLVMTGKAEVGRLGDEELFIFAAVRPVTGRAPAAGYRRMNGLVFKLRLIMAGQAEIGHG
jgi:hypothetical protein